MGLEGAQNIASEAEEVLPLSVGSVVSLFAVLTLPVLVAMMTRFNKHRDKENTEAVEREVSKRMRSRTFK